MLMPMRACVRQVTLVVYMHMHKHMHMVACMSVRVPGDAGGLHARVYAHAYGGMHERVCAR